jgi:hypothetical protein
VMYIYPNDSYREEFRQTWFHRALSCCFHRRYKHLSEQEC